MEAQCIDALGRELRRLWSPEPVRTMPLMIKLQLCHLMRADAERAPD